MSDLRAQLAAFLARCLPADTVEVDEPVLLGGGSSKQNWAFDVTWTNAFGRHHDKMMLRQDPEQGVVSTTAGPEVRLLQDLMLTEVPAPEVCAADPAGAVFGAPSVLMYRLPGGADRAVLRDIDPLSLGDAGRRDLAEQLVDLLVRVHDVDAAQVADALTDPGPDPAAYEMAHWTSELTRERERGHGDAPVLDDTLAWLAAYRPAPPGRQVLVHGDFRPANVLVDGGRVTALLDWELAHLGDPVDDLGWYTGAIYRREHFLEDWTVEDLLTRYHERTGFAPDPARLRFWQVFSTFRLTVIAVRAVRLLAEGSPMGKAAPVDRLYDLLQQELAGT